MRKTTVYEIVLSSGSLVRPWAKAAMKVFALSLLQMGAMGRAPHGHAPNNAAMAPRWPPRRGRS